MSSHPAPDCNAHHCFCQIEGWIEVTSSTGAPVRHHQTFELVLDDGSVLRTRISRPVDRTTYSRSMWSHILRDQFAVGAEGFWHCVQRGIVPARSAMLQPDPRALPLYMVNELITRLGMPPDTAAKLTAAEAADAIAQNSGGRPRSTIPACPTGSVRFLRTPFDL